MEPDVIKEEVEGTGEIGIISESNNDDDIFIPPSLGSDPLL
jgi:hypothetical protein